ncbi:uncharacterized protein RAG0_03445 [Rhynchosporium agropyri]|uniref:BD-FAE-like domain-containing protein n=1 Tax=Rhynchosporium agropyri TaxID=914238 RepID=A0A1E1K4I7_9HELO|nr:uncharacterized protein RAG0_03445 [Rhynchosporium agropyri]
MTTLSTSNFVPPLPISKTCIYKVIGKTSIPIDIYLPSCLPKNGDTHPIMLYIHGGGWLGSNRLDYCRPLFYEFLELGFVVTSMDYRLLPETSLQGQLSDIRDVEYWLKDCLGAEIGSSRIDVDIERIVVAGASAGAHLALLTPKLWVNKPAAILSLYGPTNLHHLPYQQRGRFSNPCTAICTSEMLTGATDYANPPTNTAIGRVGHPRGIMARQIFEQEIIAEFLIKGLLRQLDGSLQLPEQGSVAKEEIDAISPIHILETTSFPPVYQIMGDCDDVFDTLHVKNFHAALIARSVPAVEILVPNVLHAFDIPAEIGSEIHMSFVEPAVKWIAAWVGVGNELEGTGGDLREEVFATSQLATRPCLTETS